MGCGVRCKDAKPFDYRETTMTSNISLPSTTATTSLKRVRFDHDADPDAIKVSLFLGSNARICGWFIGPIRFTSKGIGLAYLPPADETIASVAVIRAIEAAAGSNCRVCLIDPDGLWESIWVA